ncbi:P-loop NTPase fold protein [Lachnospiraceae bacterium 62-26]
MQKMIEKIFLKLKTNIDFLVIISVFGILIYRIDALRKMCKNICIYLTTWYVDIDLVTIKNIYLCAEKLFRIIIATFLVIQFLNWLLKLVWERWLKKQKGSNRFEESLFRYLQDSSIPRCFLVTGEWGTGKTYEVEKFFDKYFRHSKTKVYRISCFGLDSRKELVKEISNTIEQNDKSFYALLIKAMQFVPIVGGAMVKFFKKAYGYDSIKRGSIFIFDDFERITSRAIIKEKSPHLYKKKSFLLSNVTHGRNSISEFKEIEKEFERVGESFQKIEDFFSYNLERIDIDKYNIAIGLINDIVEIYGMKVVIICNSEVLGEKFIYDILRSKLNCIEYRKIVLPEVRISVIDNCIKNKILIDDGKQEIIKGFLNENIKYNIDNILFERQFRNLRLYGNLLEAFIITADLFDKKDLTKEFMNSLFNSIMITHIVFYNKAFNKLSVFPSGANIEFLMKLFYGGSSILIRTNQRINDIKWIDIKVSGYWIFNLSQPYEIGNIVEDWKKYKYYETEEKILIDSQELIGVTNYDMLHVFYFQQSMDNYDNKEEWDYKTYVDGALKQYDLTKIEEIQSIVDTMGRIFQGRIYQGLFEYLFSKLIQGHENQEIVGTTYIHDMYNTYRVKKTLH